ncbi:hypothetical protein AAG570_011899 [Ranatra chinensis]|uniref:leucine--tRNA ligase n=1 Tax=Ranatra chinensis TaxID=642074 RepID=A0ABD0YVP4_9HEMI
MREQLDNLGISFDWDHKVVTCLPDYYKWTQYLFLLLYRAGLVYRKNAVVNWDPIDKTVLADEQVDSSGRSWRSNAIVEKKLLKQWFVRTTRFAHALRKRLDNPQGLEGWKDVIKLQKHWIGDCNGASFEFKVVSGGGVESTVEVWTKYPELVPRACFLTAAPGSVLDSGDVTVFNPFTNKTLPVFITNELEFDEGRDVRLGLPDAYRADLEFAQMKGIKYELINFQECPEERHRICRLALEAGIGGYVCSSKLRDWLVSRQRKWGTPIPIVHCLSCGPVPLELKHLPVLLDADEFTPCPRCGSRSSREQDTLDTFVDSSWYFLRYLDSRNRTELFCKNVASKMMPVDVYVGGKEHAVLHLYYARFMTHFLHSIKLLNDPEPFKRLLVQGMVMGKTYKAAGHYIPPIEVDFSTDPPTERATGLMVEEHWDKMSKSKHNGVDPGYMLKNYGVDTTRLIMLSDVAPTSNKYWSEDSFTGIHNWQRRLWTLVFDFLKSRKEVSPMTSPQDENRLKDARNFYVKGATFNYANSHQLSVAVAKLQGLTNSLRNTRPAVMASSQEFEKALGCLLIMIAPMAPHFANELWSIFQTAEARIDNQFFDWDKPLLKQSWPQLDSDYKLELVFKVNNAVKGSVRLPQESFTKLTEHKAVELALRDDSVIAFLGGCDILASRLIVAEDYEAILNLVIDHRQNRRIKVST